MTKFTDTIKGKRRLIAAVMGLAIVFGATGMFFTLQSSKTGLEPSSAQAVQSNESQVASTEAITPLEPTPEPAPTNTQPVTSQPTTSSKNKTTCSRIVVNLDGTCPEVHRQQQTAPSSQQPTQQPTGPLSFSLSPSSITINGTQTVYVDVIPNDSRQAAWTVTDFTGNVEFEKPGGLISQYSKGKIGIRAKVDSPATFYLQVTVQDTSNNIATKTLAVTIAQ